MGIEDVNDLIADLEQAFEMLRPAFEAECFLSGDQVFWKIVTYQPNNSFEISNGFFIKNVKLNELILLLHLRQSSNLGLFEKIHETVGAQE